MPSLVSAAPPNLPPHPSYHAAVAQKAAAVGNREHRHESTNEAIKEAHHCAADGDIPPEPSVPVDLFVSRIYDDVDGNVLCIPSSPSGNGSKRGVIGCSLSSPSRRSKRADNKATPGQLQCLCSCVLSVARPILSAAAPTDPPAINRRPSPTSVDLLFGPPTSPSHTSHTPSDKNQKQTKSHTIMLY